MTLRITAFLHYYCCQSSTPLCIYYIHQIVWSILTNLLMRFVRPSFLQCTGFIQSWVLNPTGTIPAHYGSRCLVTAPPGVYEWITWGISLRPSERYLPILKLQVLSVSVWKIISSEAHRLFPSQACWLLINWWSSMAFLMPSSIDVILQFLNFFTNCRYCGILLLNLKLSSELSFLAFHQNGTVSLISF